MQTTVEDNPEALVSLAQFYGIRGKIEREPFIQISADQEGEVSTVGLALLGAAGPLPHLIEHVSELWAEQGAVRVQRWVERGFVVEINREPSRQATGLLVMHASATDLSGRVAVRERIVQRFSVQIARYEGVRSVFLYTYSWPPQGMPGMNIERNLWTPEGGSHRIFGNEPLQRTGAFSLTERADL